MWNKLTSGPPSFFLFYFCSQSFLQGRLPLFPPQREAPLRPWTLGCSTSPPSRTGLSPGAEKKAAESSSLFLRPLGSQLQARSPCTGESLGLTLAQLALALGQALSLSWEGG